MVVIFFLWIFQFWILSLFCLPTRRFSFLFFFVVPTSLTWILLLFLRNNVYKAPIIFKKQCLIIQSPYYRNTTHSLHIYPSNFKFRKWKHVSSSFDSTSLFTSLIDDDDIGCLLSPVPPFKNIRIESFRLRVSMFHFLYTQI